MCGLKIDAGRIPGNERRPSDRLSLHPAYRQNKGKHDLIASPAWQMRAA